MNATVAPVSELRFRAMGSDVHLIVVGGSSGLIDQAQQRIDQLETRWSRFRPDSEISSLNTSPGIPVPVSDDTRLLVARSIEAWRISGGGFDPLVLPDVIRAGYDRSYEQLPAARDATTASIDRRSIADAGCTDIEITDATVTLPAGTGFDPGGIGKGLTADLVVEQLMQAGAAGACVNMGGDVRVVGTAPGGGTWTVAIEHPHLTRPITLVGLGQGAVATSTVLRRTWTVGGVGRHHLIDPATGEPSATDIGLATVIAATAWEAEVYAKAVLLRGTTRAFDLLDASTQALIVSLDGRVTVTDGFAAFTSPTTPPATVQFDRTPIHDVGSRGDT